MPDTQAQIMHRVCIGSLVKNLDFRWAPRARLNHYGGRAFAHSAPELWNSLPHELRALWRSKPVSGDIVEHFKRALKTHLFSNAF